MTVNQMPKNIAVSPSGGSQLTVTGTDQFGNALPSSPAFAWPAAGLTLQLAADGYLHLYQSGTTTDVVPPYAEAGLNSVTVTGLNGASESLTVDLSGGQPIPAGRNHIQRRHGRREFAVCHRSARRQQRCDVRRSNHR